MKKILFIIPYFGKFNNYFSWWLKSCKYNPTIDWLLLTDCRDSYNYPPNVHVQYTTFKELKERFEKCLKMNIAITKPYKFCDLRPAFGEVFKEECSRYDFWGHCDVDLIFGDIRSFLTDRILDEFDRISTWGHMSLYKNAPYMNNLFREKNDCIPHYTEVFSSDVAYCFDEVGMRNICAAKKIKVLNTAEMIFNIDWKKKVYAPLYWGNDKKFRYVFNWNEGRLTTSIFDGSSINEREILYVHFQKRKIQNRAEDSNSLFIYSDILSSEKIKLSPLNFRTYAKKSIVDCTMFWYYLDKILVKLSLKKGTSFYTYRINK